MGTRLSHRTPVAARVFLAVALALAPVFAAGEGHPSKTRGWETLPGMPTVRSEIACAVVGEKVYVVGGIGLDGSKRAFEALDLRIGRWEKLAPLPTKLNHSGVAASQGVVYVSGGFLDLRQKRLSSSLHAYDTRTGEWRDLGPMPAPRHKHFMIARDGWLHLFGGLGLRETWSYRIATGEWRTDRIAPIPEQRDHITVLQDASSLYIVGGRRDRSAQAACWRYDFRKGRWSVFAELPLARSAPTAVLHRGRIHVVGGEDVETQETFRRHDILDLATGRWSAGEPLPRPRHGMASCKVGDRWIVIGGGRRAEVGTVFTATRATEAMRLGGGR